MAAVPAPPTSSSDDNGRYRLDLANAIEFIAEAGEMVAVMNGQRVEGEGKAAASNEAYLTRRLLNAADILEMAVAHIRNEYWGLKGGVSFDV